ncbi:hypothetical protein [Streptomyces sp. NPDC004270]
MRPAAVAVGPGRGHQAVLRSSGMTTLFDRHRLGGPELPDRGS